MHPTATPTTNSSTQSSDLFIENAIRHAAHMLPAQGPITAFVHHNTLHAFEDLEFDAAVRKGARLFGCHPYLPEKQYREMLETGRIRTEDIEAVLHQQLGDREDDLLGFLGTRFGLYQAILNFALHDGPSVDIRWVVGDTNALNKFREDAPTVVRERFLKYTKRWAMQDLRSLAGRPAGSTAGSLEAGLKSRVSKLFEMFDGRRIEPWSDEKWESFSLHLLWQVCEHGADQIEVVKSVPSWLRHRDWIRGLSAVDTDELVHEMLIQFCAVFMDQGLSDWPLESRDEGFYQSFITIFGQKSWLAAPWRKGLDAELRRLRAEDVSAIDSIKESLRELGIDSDSEEKFIETSLLALRGFAGMIWQLETRGDRVSRGMPEGTLLEFLAVRLILDRFAAKSAIKQLPEFDGALAEFPQWALKKIQSRKNGRQAIKLREAFRVFELAQLLGWHPQSLARLSASEWQSLIKELDDFSGIDRRMIYHLAFERKFRNEALDSVLVHTSRVASADKSNGNREAVAQPEFQLVCCIDDREESFRRHLEEIVPNCETFGAAGFFAIPMYYRGAADAHYLPLCPAVVVPDHYIREEVPYSLKESASKRKRVRRTIGTVARKVHLGSRTFTGGWIGTTILGSFATFPLVFRVMFPRLTARVKSMVGGLVRPPTVTQLHLERDESQPPGPNAEQLGLTVDEMASAVERLLRDMSVTDNFAPIFFVCGHGSSSLNNPHEAAYNCGACAGGRGGPNARAFAQMANDPRVRKIVAKNGITLPAETIFIGCYHNTCDDSVAYFDLDAIPASHQSLFEKAVEGIDEARRRDAHERCRRFESAPLDLTFEQALVHVEGRAEDLSQARPEYNHATNALCFVGRREWSRGLFLDRRAFLQSYDPAKDDADCTILERVLQAVIPVCAGINLEYYFSCVDHVGYGAGNKLPHNITSLIGVMDGAASDLRPGLYHQMIEIHEPMRLLFVIETTESAMTNIIAANEPIRKLCEGNWVQLAILLPEYSATESPRIKLYRNGKFEDYVPSSKDVATASSSHAWYHGWRDNLKFASIDETAI